GRHEGETNTLTQRDPLLWVGVGWHRDLVGDGFDPAPSRQLGERIVERAGALQLRRAQPPRAVGERVEAHARGDAGEPGAQRGALLEATESAPRPYHGLLHGVVSIRDRAHHAVAVARECGAVLLEVGRGDHHWTM